MCVKKKRMTKVRVGNFLLSGTISNNCNNNIVLHNIPYQSKSMAHIWVRYGMIEHHIWDA